MTRKQTKDLTLLGGAMETKDLAATMHEPIEDLPLEDETDEAAAPEPAMAVREVELIHHYTFEGRNRLPGERVVVPADLAAKLVGGAYATYTG